MIYNLELKKYNEAIADFTEMIRLQSYSTAGYKLRGISYALSENYKMAADDLTLFIESDSTDLNAYSTRSYCNEKLQNWAQAAYDAEMVLKLSPEKNKSLVNTIVSNYEQAIGQYPDDYVKFRYAKFLLSQYQSKEALKQMNMLADSGYTPALDFLVSYKRK